MALIDDRTAAEKAVIQDKVTTGAIVGSGAIIGGYVAGPFGFVIGSILGVAANYGRKQALK